MSAEESQRRKGSSDLCVVYEISAARRLMKDKKHCTDLRASDSLPLQPQSSHFQELEQNVEQRNRVINALNLMADKAELKYHNGWRGTARKVFTWVRNLFVGTNYIRDWNAPARKIISWISNAIVKGSFRGIFYTNGLFNPDVNLFYGIPDLKMPDYPKNNLPYILGSDATFARLVANSYKA